MKSISSVEGYNTTPIAPIPVIQPLTATPQYIKRVAQSSGLSIAEVEAHLAAGRKHCSRCKDWKSATHDNFSPNKSHAFGLYPYCRPCFNQQQREGYHQRAQKLPPGEAAQRVMEIDPALFPPAAPGDSIGCLRCRHAEIHFDTEFKPGNTRPVIFCGRENVVRCIRWHSCPIADPRLAKPRHLHKYTAKWGALGDKMGHAGPVLLAFLKAYWMTAPAEQMEKATGWTMFKLGAIVRYHKIGGARTEINRLHHVGAKRERRFTIKQSQYLLREYCSDRWPRPTVCFLKPDEYERRLSQQREVVRDVRALNPEGPKWTWEQIQRHVHKKMRKRHDDEQKRRRGERRRINQHVAIPFKKLPEVTR